MSDDLLLQFTAHCTRLSEVTLVGCHHLTDRALDSLLTDLPALKHLSVSGIGWTGEGFGAVDPYSDPSDPVSSIAIVQV